MSLIDITEKIQFNKFALILTHYRKSLANICLLLKNFTINY